MDPLFEKCQKMERILQDAGFFVILVKEQSLMALADGTVCPETYHELIASSDLCMAEIRGVLGID